MQDNPIIEILKDFGISNDKSLVHFHSGVRGNKKINVLRCKKSGIYCLDKLDIQNSYYRNNKKYTIHNKDILNDNDRFVNQNKEIFSNAKILDFGCSQGLFIKKVSPIAKKVTGIEINHYNLNKLVAEGFDVRDSVAKLSNDDRFNYICLFHVFEHLSEPLTIIESLIPHLEEGGEFIIEVPQAKDFLINELNLESFKNFTFWKEHLILHTQHSLSIFFNNLGLKTKKIIPVQRYPLSNHFYWYLKGKPGGHIHFSSMFDSNTVEKYENFLIKQGTTDTIVGYFSK